MKRSEINDVIREMEAMVKCSCVVKKHRKI